VAAVSKPSMIVSMRSTLKYAGGNARRHDHRCKQGANQKISHKQNSILSEPLSCTKPCPISRGRIFEEGTGAGQKGGIATRCEQRGSLVAWGLRMEEGLFATIGEGAVCHRGLGPGEPVAYVSSLIWLCGIDATIAGQATIATNARATRMSCMAGSSTEIPIQSRSVNRYWNRVTGNSEFPSVSNQNSSYHCTPHAPRFNRIVPEGRTSLSNEGGMQPGPKVVVACRDLRDRSVQGVASSVRAARSSACVSTDNCCAARPASLASMASFTPGMTTAA